MIAVINVEIQAANPSMPLFPWRAYVNSPSSLRIRNVPRRVGNWNIDKVYVSAAYPDNSIKSAECVLVGGIWVCTIAGSTSTGFSQNGYTIYADGKDENGNEVTGYILGKGDITILEADGTITPGETFYYVHMLSAQPTAPKDGDLWQLSGTWYIYQDGTSYPIGGDSGLIQQLSARVDGVETAISSKADVSSLNNYLPLSGGTMSDNNQSAEIAPWGIGLYNDYILTSLDTYTHTFDVRTDMAVEFSKLSDSYDGISLADKFSSKADKSQLANYELKANMSQDVSSIVLSSEDRFSDWDIVVPANVPGYYVLNPHYPDFFPNSIEDQTIGTWYVQVYNPEDHADFIEWGSDNQQSISALALDLSVTIYGSTLPNLSATRTIEDKNVLGLVLEQQLPPRLSYSLVSRASVQLEDRAVQHVSLGLSNTVFALPQLISGKVNDFVFDVTNTYAEGGTPVAASFSLSGTIGTDFNIVVPKDESFAEMTTLEAGEMAEFYFTRTSFELGGLPTWKVVKQVVDQYTPTAI